MKMRDYDKIVAVAVVLLVVAVVIIFFYSESKNCPACAEKTCPKCVPTSGYESRISELEEENQALSEERDAAVLAKNLCSDVCNERLEGKVLSPLAWNYQGYLVEKNKWGEYIDLGEYLKKSHIIDLEENASCSGRMIEVINCLVNKTQERMSYEFNQGFFPASDAWQTKKGDCSEYSAVFCSLARNHGIPCRVVEGQVEWSNMTHLWVEVMLFDLNGWEWVIIEPTETVNGEQPDCIASPETYHRRFTYTW